MSEADSFSFIIDNIKDLPVVANQNQEFWLSARATCREVVEDRPDSPRSGKVQELSPALFVSLFHRSIALYEDLARCELVRRGLPSWQTLLTEALEARERIYGFRSSELLHCLGISDKQPGAGQEAIQIAFRIAQHISILPGRFIEWWLAYLTKNGGHPCAIDAHLAVADAINQVDYSVAIQSAAHEARRALIEGYLRYVLRIARGYINLGLEFADLVQEGALGLIVAAERFNFVEHGRFAAFATTWIWQHITRSLAEHSRLILLPARASQRLQELQKQLSNQLSDRGTTSSLNDLIVSRGLSASECVPILESGVRPIRLDSPQPKLTRRELEILLGANCTNIARVEAENMIDKIRSVVHTLPERQATVISLRFGLGDEDHKQTLVEIAGPLKVSRERVRQMETIALGACGKRRLGRQLYSLFVSLEENRASAAEDILVRARVACRRALGPLGCDEVLSAGHPFAADSGVFLDELLRRAFGSRQSKVRRSLTIKGRIVAAFDGYRSEMHTSELQTRLRALFPLDRYSEKTLYSVMFADRETFAWLGQGVFRLAKTIHKEVDTAFELSQPISVLGHRLLMEPLLLERTAETVDCS